MALVPVSRGEQTRLDPLPGGRLKVFDQTAGLRSIAGGLQDLGNAANEAAERQERVDRMLDEAAVKKADNEDSAWFRDQLYNSDNAFYRQQGFNAANAAAALREQMTKRREAQAAALSTPRQRAMYSEVAERRFGAEMEGIQRHAIGQLAAEEERQSISRIAAASDDAVLNWADPEKREAFVQTAIGEIRGRAQKQGWAPEVMARAESEARSNITARAVQSLFDNGKVEEAHAEVVRNRSSLLEKDLAMLERQLYGPLLDRQAEAVVDDLMGTLPATPTVVASAQATGEVLPRMVDITAQAESGNRERDSKGRLITSPVGAQGKMQVMPGTNRDPGFGVTPARDNSDEERTRVGRDYITAMMKRYGGDPAKAWAAYNWGPGNLDNAIAKHGGDWLSHAPAETKAYVTRNVAALGGRGANPPVQQSPREHDLAQLLARIDGLNLPHDLEDKVRARLTQRVSLDETLLRRDQAAAAEEAWQIVEGKGEGFVSVESIPQRIRDRMSVGDRRSLSDEADRNSNKPRETNWTQYSRYSDLYATNPKALAGISPLELRRNLSDSDFEQVMGWRRDAQAPGGSSGASSSQVTHERIRGVIQPLARAVGVIAPTGLKGKAAETAKATFYKQEAALEAAVQRDVALWRQANNGKMPTDDIIRDIADTNLIRMYRDPDGPGGKPREFAGYQFQVREQTGLTFDMPKADKERIERAYRERWDRSPTAEEVSEIYRRGPRGGR